MKLMLFADAGYADRVSYTSSVSVVIVMAMLGNTAERASSTTQDFVTLYE